jgi:hypothetical protein
MADTKHVRHPSTHLPARLALLLLPVLPLLPLPNLLAGLSLRVELRQQRFTAGYAQCPLQFPRGIPA